MNQNINGVWKRNKPTTQMVEKIRQYVRGVKGYIDRKKLFSINTVVLNRLISKICSQVVANSRKKKDFGEWDSFNMLSTQDIRNFSILLSIHLLIHSHFTFDPFQKATGNYWIVPIWFQTTYLMLLRKSINFESKFK